MKSIRRIFCRAIPAIAMTLTFSAQAQSLAFSNSPVQAIPRRDSIILIVADGIGYGDLSCYGQQKFQTPNLDKLAADGVRFSNFSGDNDAAKSAAQLMFGKSLGYGDLSVAQILRNAGYRTGFIGQWNLGDENSANAPWRRGFDEFGGYLNDVDAKNFYADYIWSLPPDYSYDAVSNQWVPWREGQPHNAGKEMLYDNTRGKNQYIPDLFAKVVNNFVKNNVPDPANHYRPFFLVVHLPIPGDGANRAPSDAPYSDEPWPAAEKNKAALISRLDGYVGQWREQLTKSGMTNNVVIFFTSGFVPQKANGLDPAFFHSNVSTNDVRVPLIVSGTKDFLGGHVNDFKCAGKDFLPTAAEIGYAKTPKGIDGISILSAESKPSPK